MAASVNAFWKEDIDNRRQIYFQKSYSIFRCITAATPPAPLCPHHTLRWALGTRQACTRPPRGQLGAPRPRAPSSGHPRGAVLAMSLPTVVRQDRPVEWREARDPRARARQEPGKSQATAAWRGRVTRARAKSTHSRLTTVRSTPLEPSAPWNSGSYLPVPGATLARLLRARPRGVSLPSMAAKKGRRAGYSALAASRCEPLQALRKSFGPLAGQSSGGGHGRLMGPYPTLDEIPQRTQNHCENFSSKGPF